MTSSPLVTKAPPEAPLHPSGEERYCGVGAEARSFRHPAA
jgi:hypothetical protein